MLVVVADGVSSHPGGERASRMAVDVTLRAWPWKSWRIWKHFCIALSSRKKFARIVAVISVVRNPRSDFWKRA